MYDCAVSKIQSGKYLLLYREGEDIMKKTKLFCEDCGREIEEKQAYPADKMGKYFYCRKCHEKNLHYNGIHDTDYKPEQTFSDVSDLRLSLTIDIDGGGFLDSKAEKLLKTVNKSYESHMYIVKNERLRQGFTLVFRPMTAESIMNDIPWDRLCRQMKELGYDFGDNCHMRLTDEKNAVKIISGAEVDDCGDRIITALDSILL